MKKISSQDFRNVYEKFYKRMRVYLWPYAVIKELADVEVDIYTTFIDMRKLDNDLNKLYSSIKDCMTEDHKLTKLYSELRELVDKVDVEQYSTLPSVSESNPQNDKVLKFNEPEENQDENN